MIKEAERYLDYARVDWEYRKWAKSDGEENRKYFRVKINRIPPYYPINAAYDFEEDVWAYSDKGAENKVKGQYKKCYGSHVIEKVIEVSKADFRGDKKVVM